jgi:hypothetical protein
MNFTPQGIMRCDTATLFQWQEVEEGSCCASRSCYMSFLGRSAHSVCSQAHLTKPNILRQYGHCPPSFLAGACDCAGLPIARPVAVHEKRHRTCSSHAKGAHTFCIVKLSSKKLWLPSCAGNQTTFRKVAVQANGGVAQVLPNTSLLKAQLSAPRRP